MNEKELKDAHTFTLKTNIFNGLIMDINLRSIDGKCTRSNGGSPFQFNSLGFIGQNTRTTLKETNKHSVNNSIS